MVRSKLPLASRRSREAIDQEALRQLERCFPECIEDPGPVPIDQYVEFHLPRILPVVFGVGDLPIGLEAKTSPAKDGKSAELILSTYTYSALGRGFSRARFTAGHEVGHAHLHLHEIDVDLVSGEAGVLYRTSEIPNDQNPERQADMFAAAFLMPAPAVQRAFQILGLNVRTLADTFQVSDAAMSWRLREIGLR